MCYLALQKHARTKQTQTHGSAISFISEKQKQEFAKTKTVGVRNLPREDDHAIRSSLKMAQSHKAVRTNMFLIDLGTTLQKKILIFHQEKSTFLVVVKEITYFEQKCAFDQKQDCIQLCLHVLIIVW